MTTPQDSNSDGGAGRSDGKTSQGGDSKSHGLELFEQFDWVSRLARRLCADAGMAEDVSQETLMAAYQAGWPPASTTLSSGGAIGSPNSSGSGESSPALLRRWLAGVLRNRVRHQKRSQVRRADHEAAAAREQALIEKLAPSAAELVERASAQRQVVDRVLELDEPYRSVVLLRYFEELAPPEIAQRHSLPVATVKTQLRRGLELLRSKLDADGDGDGRSWVLALMPLFREPGLAGAGSGLIGAVGTSGTVGTAQVAASKSVGTLNTAGTGSLAGGTVAAGGTAATGALLVSTKPYFLPVVFAIATVLGGVIWNRVSSRAVAPASADLSENVQDIAMPDADRGSARPNESVAQRSAVEEAQEQTVEATNAAAGEALFAVSAIVVDVDSNPVSNVRVSFRPQASKNGTRELGSTDDQGRLEFEMEADSGFVFVRDAGYVTLSEGAVQAVGTRAEPTIVVSRSRNLSGRTFDVEGRPLSGVEVAYYAGANLNTRLEVAMDQATRQIWRATSNIAGEFQFTGVPEAPGAVLEAELNGYEVTSFDLADQGDQALHVVLKELATATSFLSGLVLDDTGYPVEGARVSLGMLSVKTDGAGAFQLDLEESPDALVLRAVAAGAQPASLERKADELWPSPVELTLGGASLSLAGRVVDEHGVALSNVAVELLQPTEFGWVRTVENDDTSWIGTSIERLSGGWTEIVTDERGEFAISGLMDRGYRLVLSQEGTMNLHVTDTLTAGRNDLELVLPSPKDLIDVSGRVVNQDGVPVAGANIHVSRSRMGSTADGVNQTTGEDGLFELTQVITDGVSLYLFAGPGHAMRSYKLEDFDDLTDIELVLPENAHIFVDLGNRADSADKFALLNEEGEVIPLGHTQGLGAFQVQGGWFSEGRSPVFQAATGKCSLVLYLKGEEVERFPVELTAGETKRVDL